MTAPALSQKTVQGRIGEKRRGQTPSWHVCAIVWQGITKDIF